MKVRDEHLYHGAALNQIAEHPQFTAINPFKLNGSNSRSTFRINSDVAVYLKYASEPQGPWDEYVFSFNEEHLDEIRKVSAKVDKAFIALICVEDREVCCITASDLEDIIKKRRAARGEDEPVYNVLVTAKKNSKLRVYSNVPHKKGKKLGELKVARNAYPDCLF